MSNRVLKKLHGDKIDHNPIQTEDLNDSDGDQSIVKNSNINRFQLLDFEDQSQSDTEVKEEDDMEITAPRKQNKGNKKNQEKQDFTQEKRKKKKKRKPKNQNIQEDNLDNVEDEIEASLREVNAMLGEPESCTLPQGTAQSNAVDERSLLTMQHKLLNPKNEMKKMFGSIAVQDDLKKKKGRSHSYTKTTFLIPNFQNSSQLGKSGISMTYSGSKDGVMYFNFEHSKEYQTIQFEFLAAVERSDSETIYNLVNAQPSNMDVLIQLSDICKQSDDSQRACELLEWALYIAEIGFHPLFNLVQGNCRLDFKRSENRSFYLALFKHMLFVGQRGCYRTALEICKLLLSLDPENDPLGMTLTLDYYALMSGQHEYLSRLYQEWDSTRNLYQLPNFAFSVPLALRRLSLETELTSEADNLIEKASLMLQNSLIMFPGLLTSLLEACHVEPDARVSNHSFFGTQSQVSQPQALKHLVNLYVGRCHSLWKDPSVISWLESCVNQVLARVDARDLYVADCQEKRNIRYQGTARNILRHIFLSNIKESSNVILAGMPNQSVYGFDPFPPLDAVVSYQLPIVEQQPIDSGVLNAFFQSLLPNFNQGGDNNAAAAAALVQAEAVAQNPNAAGPNNLAPIVDAMRRLFRNIQMNAGDDETDEEE